MKCLIYRTEYRFTEWIKAKRKDVECTIGILKGRFCVLKTGIRLHGLLVTVSIWMTCCALHNLFLYEDGLMDEWENRQSVWETELGNHEEDDVLSNVPAQLLEHFENPAEFDLSGMGPGTDQDWPENGDNNNANNEKYSSSSGTSNGDNEGSIMDIDIDDNNNSENGK
jgi:Plant transposon protein